MIVSLEMKVGLCHPVGKCLICYIGRGEIGQLPSILCMQKFAQNNEDPLGKVPTMQDMHEIPGKDLRIGWHQLPQHTGLAPRVNTPFLMLNCMQSENKYLPITKKILGKWQVPKC